MSGFLKKHSEVEGHVTLDTDVCIVGSGAGGSVVAARLTALGLRVVLLEEGGSYTRREFTGNESQAYPTMYQERGLRATDDLAISIFQGKVVGGGSTVNWTTCFRTPDRILRHWQERHGAEGWSSDALLPHFEAVEERLGIAEWEEFRANENNKVLLDGCRNLGWQVEALRRNVRNCGNTGMCGLGCPIDAKQGMHLTYLRDAIERGLHVYSGAKVERFETAGDRVVAVHARLADDATGRATGATLTVRPKVAVSSAGAINGPALLLRSGINPNQRTGKRTMLHPVVALPALYEREINGFYGAPQSISSHHFIERPGRVGYFLETPPLQPMIVATASPLFGEDQHEMMRHLPHIGVLIALSIDGLDEHAPGGEVSLRPDGRVRVQYPITDALIEAMRDAHKTMARIELAAGAIQCQSTHVDPVIVRSEADIARFDDAPFGALHHAIFTAHQMGGCTMGSDPATSVVNPRLQHHHIPNLFCVDGSVFPTSLGVNPSQTIYAMAHRAAEFVAEAVS